MLGSSLRLFDFQLGAFGFLASEEINENGLLNAGLNDQAFAFSWVQEYISAFGGDPSRVTISGESAGGGSVMYHAMAQQATLGTTLFKNVGLMTTLCNFLIEQQLI